MGDYFRSKTDTVKIGTCGDNRYMRYEEALALRAFDQGGEVEGNLKYVEALWRFPFPKEDNASLLAIQERNMFDTLTFTVPHELLPTEHEDFCVCIHAQDMPYSYGINRLLPCPLSSLDKVYGQNIASPIIQIYGERYKEGKGRTIFRCGYCGKPFSISPEELPKFQDALMNNVHPKDPQNPTYQYYKAVAERLKAQT